MSLATWPKTYPPASERLLERRKITPSGCWLYTGRARKGGDSQYGAIYHENRQWMVHRLAFHLWVAPVRRHQHICHRCDRPLCFNPAHLYSGTPQSNMDDKVRAGRQCRGERNNLAKLTEAIVLRIRAADARGALSTTLAKRYRVSFQTIRHIVRRKTWKHI